MKTKIIFYIFISILILISFPSCKKSAVVNNTPEPSTGTNITLQSGSFSPSTITVAVGTTITWTNNSSIIHTVTSGIRPNPDGIFNSGDLSSGETFQFTFNTSGTFTYYCIYHNGMDGTVIVQ